MVDRGGLDYVITVRNQFSAQLAKLRRELTQTRAEFAKLRTESGRNAGRASGQARQQVTAQRQVRDAVRSTSNEQRTAARQQQSALRAIANAQRQRTRREREIQRIVNAARRDEAREERRRERAARRAELAERRRLKAIKQRRAEQRAFVRSLIRTDNAANRVSFTFRRLFGILAAFAAARLVVEAFARGLIGTAINTNRQIETSRISIAALITAVGQVTNAQGELLTGQKAFAEATRQSRRQVQLLRQDAVGTTATFQELLRAFQAGVGPGLEAGLNLDQIREITVRTSQAAAALTVPQNQLIEEIRSLLRGTIQARTTIVASVLGITNEDVREAREAGELFEFLSGKLQAFQFASAETQKTFDGLISNVADAIGFAGGPASLGFFDAIKESLTDFIGLFVDIERNDAGIIESILPNPQAVAVLSALFDSLAGALRRLGDTVAALSFADLLRAAQAVGTVLSILGQAIVGFVQGFVEGLSFVTRLGGAISEAFGGDGLSNVKEFVRQVTRIGVVLIAASVGASLIFGAMRAIAVPLQLALTLVVGLGTAVFKVVGFITKLPIGLTLVVGLAAAALFFFKQWVDEVAGFEVKLSTLGKIIKNLFLDTVQIVGARLGLVATLIVETIKRDVITVTQQARVLLTRITTTVGSFFRSILGTIFATASLQLLELADKAAELAPATAAQLQGLAAGLGSASAALTKGVRDNEKQLADTVADSTNKIKAAEADRLNAIAEARTKLAALEEQAARNFNDAINQDGEAPSVVDTLEGKLASLKTTLDGLFASFNVDGDIINVEDIAEKLKDAVEKGLGTVTGREGESKFEKLFKGLADSTQAGLAIARQAVVRFSSFVASSIVDAFDPTKDFDIKERFARFLQEIASLIIQQLTQIAIAKAVLGLGFQSGGQVPGAGAGLRYGGTVPQGYADGGKIGAASPSPTLAHFGLPGTQPSNIDPRDTQPIWAQPGEFMQPVNAVRRYGIDVMEKMRRGLINPHDLRALAGSVGNVASLRRSVNHGPGFQEGGLIGDQIGDVRDSLASAGEAREDQVASGPTPAFIMADDQSVDRFLNGGKAGFVRFLRENSEEFDGILRSSRPAGA